ncbi:MAG: 2-hydroxychromene-2-carboxylate isomerase [Burkholderiales bacterium]|nr:MAG: 2-hydroxychromene-2-carboxylate isomerase [Burkholderiales bacterium]
MSRIEFFYDVSSPWTYMAFEAIQPILAETQAGIVWWPFLVGGVFNAANQQVYANRENTGSSKSRATSGWIKEWAAFAGVPMNFPSPYHPLRSVNLMRFCCALEQDQEVLERFSRAAFEAYFRDQRNLDDAAECAAVADACGLDGASLTEAAQSAEVKDRLRANTQEAIDRGAFGSPTIFVDGEHMYFGNDQLPLVRRRLMTTPR